MQTGTVRIECSETGRRVWIDGHEITHFVQCFIASEKADGSPNVHLTLAPTLLEVEGLVGLTLTKADAA